MDLGIAGKWALVCGASKGLGLGCAQALAGEGVNLLMVARGESALAQAAAEIRAAGADRAGVSVEFVAQDITTPEGRAAVLARRAEFDIVVTNAGGPPTGDFRDWDRQAWIRALDANMLTPIELIRATLDGMLARGFGRIVNITSSAVKAPIDILGLSNGARSGLTGFVAGLARNPQIAARGGPVTIDLPGERVTLDAGHGWSFTIDAEAKAMLLEGLDALLLRELEVGAGLGVGPEPGAVGLVIGQRVEADQSSGLIVPALPGQPITEQPAAEARNDAAPALGVAAESVSLKRVDLIADKAGDGGQGHRAALDRHPVHGPGRPGGPGQRPVGDRRRLADEFGLTHQQLADELGTVREIVTRLLRRFEREGWVRLGRERIHIADSPALRALAATLQG